jgi:hypothetical protein
MLHSRPRRRTSGTAAAPTHRSRAGIGRSLLAGVVAGTVVLTGAAAVPDVRRRGRLCSMSLPG